MAYDLFFGKNKRNWSRDLLATAPTSDEVTVHFTDEEKNFLSQITITKMKADAGDKSAKKQLVALTKKIAALKTKSRKGDEKAKRALLILRESGIFNPTQKMDLSGAVVPNQTRAQLLEAVRKLREKNPKTADDNRELEQLQEKICRLEAMSGSFVGRESRAARRARRARNLQSRSLGEEELALAGDGGRAERASQRRLSGIGGLGVSNTVYRATVQKQAIKHAGGKRPSTKDLFLAKSAVDKAIGKAGIQIFMPGSQPGRRTI
jgi:hypothetical protein